MSDEQHGENQAHGACGPWQIGWAYLAFLMAVVVAGWLLATNIEIGQVRSACVTEAATDG